MQAPSTLLTHSLRPYLLRCGYAKENLIEDLQVSDSHRVSLAAFSQRPFDNRSACIVAVDAGKQPLGNDFISHSHSVGAPVLLVCANDYLYWWKQSVSAQSEEYRRVPANQIEGFFREHQDDLAPQTIYRAKTLGRFDVSHQREFVDLGLMPLLEKQTGEFIQNLLLEQVRTLREHLHLPKELTLEQGQWLVKAIFWLLGAKMLHDKEVEGFIRLDFGDVGKVFDRVAHHYGESAEAIVTNEERRRALQIASNAIGSGANLTLATTESLGHVYENTLISKEIRKELGTHSTPSFLIDYIVGRLEPWIAAMPSEQRQVFEPACGHAGFLVAAVRLLTSLLPSDQAAPQQRRAYLRKMVQGRDVDDFAIEIARLSLTLTDIPNPNGWQLKQGDAFASDVLENLAGKSRIILANPPFESFKAEDRRRYAQTFREPLFINKTAEMLYRTITALPSGGVFGLVVPQNLLHSKDALEFRKLLANSTEFDEICLFPDKVFNFADVESAVLIGRKVEARSDSSKEVRYRRVRDGEMEHFRINYGVTSDVKVTQARFQDSDSHDLRVPDLEEIWAYCADLPKLGDLVEIGQGFSFIGKDQPNYPKGEERTSPVAKQGFEEGFENLGKGVMTHQLPPLTYLNMSSKIILAERSGVETGVPQVIVNEAPVQRSPWCVRAMLDQSGKRITSSFTAFRNNADQLLLWAILNSPIGNAFAYVHSSKWHILTGTWKQLRVPSQIQNAEKLVKKAATKYLDAVYAFDADFSLRNDEDRETQLAALRTLHWRMDAEVLKLYQLPATLEKKLLVYFAGCKRVGVPFHQDHYLPTTFEEPISLADYLAITADWEETNSKRLALIDKKLKETITHDEKKELARLKQLAWAKAQLVNPLPLQETKAVEKELKRKGLWIEA